MKKFLGFLYIRTLIRVIDGSAFKLEKELIVNNLVDTENELTKDLSNNIIYNASLILINLFFNRKGN